MGKKSAGFRVPDIIIQLEESALPCVAHNFPMTWRQSQRSTGPMGENERFPAVGGK